MNMLASLATAICWWPTKIVGMTGGTKTQNLQMNEIVEIVGGTKTQNLQMDEPEDLETEEEQREEEEEEEEEYKRLIKGLK